MKSRLLVIDDNVNLTTLLCKALGRFNYDVVKENDSTFAMETIQRVRPDLIILDVMMPHRDGGQVLADLRADLQLRSIPVILLTALAREAQGLANLGGMSSPVLAKPVDIKTLLMEIERQIEGCKTMRELTLDEVALIPSSKNGVPRHLEPERASRNAFGAPVTAGGSQGSAFGSGIPSARRGGTPPLQFESLRGRLRTPDTADTDGLPR